jgi:hypothetical protein
MINNEQTTIRALAALTASYVASSVTDITDASQVYVYVTYTKGDESSCQVKFEYSPDGTLYGQETALSISGGTSTDSLLEHTISATGTYTYQLPAMGMKFRASLKATGGTPTGTAKVELQEGNA